MKLSELSPLKVYTVTLKCPNFMCNYGIFRCNVIIACRSISDIISAATRNMALHANATSKVSDPTAQVCSWIRDFVVCMQQCNLQALNEGPG